MAAIHREREGRKREEGVYQGVKVQRGREGGRERERERDREGGRQTRSV